MEAILRSLRAQMSRQGFAFVAPGFIIDENTMVIIEDEDNGRQVIVARLIELIRPPPDIGLRLAS